MLNLYKKRTTAQPTISGLTILCALSLLVTTAYAFLPALPVAQVAQIAYNAGFRGDGLVNAIAIGWAESSFIPDNVNTTGNYPVGSRDRGIWQINSAAHPEVSDSCAFDPVCAAGQTYRISNGGTNWSPWTTYGGTRYNEYLPTARTAAANVSPTSSTELYVDGNSGNSGNGNAGSPFNTIAAAISAASTSQPVTIHIVPFWYKEKISTSKHLQFLANGPGTVRIGG